MRHYKPNSHITGKYEAFVLRVIHVRFN